MADKIQSGEASIAPGLALVFDMDGVIVDSNPMHREAWTAFNLRYGLETTEEMHRRMYGKRNDAIVRDFFGDGLTPEEIKARGAAKEELYREMIGSRLEEMLVPGVREFLEHYRHVPMAVATNAEPANVDFLLDRAGLRRYFQQVVDGSQVSHPKPHPEVYLRAAELLRTDPRNCIVFEDSAVGRGSGAGGGDEDSITLYHSWQLAWCQYLRGYFSERRAESMVASPRSGCLKSLGPALALAGAVLCFPLAAQTTVVKLRDINARDASRQFSLVHLNERADVTGVVNSTPFRSSSETLLTMEADGYGAVVRVLKGDTRLAGFTPGDEIRVEGQIAQSAGMAVIVPEKIEKLGRKPAPVPKELSVEDLEGNRYVGRLVRSEFQGGGRG